VGTQVVGDIELSLEVEHGQAQAVLFHLGGGVVGDVRAGAQLEQVEDVEVDSVGHGRSRSCGLFFGLVTFRRVCALPGIDIATELMIS
jgi:hypothetical protein